MTILSFILDSFSQKKKLFWIVFLIGLVDGVFVLILPYLLSLIRPIPDFLSTNFGILELMVIIYITSLVTSYCIRRYGELLALIVAEKSKISLISKLLNVPLDSLQQNHSGYLLTLVNSLADRFPPLVFQIFWWITRGISNLLVLIYLAFSRSFWVGFLDLFVILLFVFVSQILSRKILPLNLALNNSKAIFAGRFIDFMTNISTISSLGIGKYVESRLSRDFLPVEKDVIAQQKFHAMRWFILHAIFGIILFSTIGICLYQVSLGILDPSIFVILIYILVSLRGDLNSLAENLKLLTELSSYYAQVKRIIGNKVISQKSIEKSNYLITISNLTIEHKASKVMIKIPEFSLQRGEIIALKGDSGQGKSSFLRQILNVSEKEASGIKCNFLPSEVTIVSQEVELFDMSLRDNLLLGKKIAESELKIILQELNLWDLVIQNEQGLDCMIGEKGLRLSAGQKQRINLIRAIIQDKPILLLDEPISHLDQNNISLVVKFLQKHLQNKTAIIVSHQSEVLKLASKKYEFKDHILRST